MLESALEWVDTEPDSPTWFVLRFWGGGYSGSACSGRAAPYRSAGA
jgi:hypothetical protein